MKRFILGVISTAALVVSGMPLKAQVSGHGPDGGGRWTVVFRSATLPADAVSRVAAAGGRVEKSVREVGVLTASGGAAFAARLAADGAVLAVGPETFYTLPQPIMGSVEGVEPAEFVESEIQTIGAPTAADVYYRVYGWNVRRIAAPAMWARISLETQANSTVAVLDSGVMHTHPDLNGQLVATFATNYCQETFGGNPAYPIYGTLIDFNANPEWTPAAGCTAAPVVYHAHGTHVAGTIAAKFGGAGVVGVAPGVRLAAYKVFDRYRYKNEKDEIVEDFGAFDGAVFSAIVDAASRGYKTINMSLGSTIDRRGQNANWLAWDRVAKYADRMGVTIVAAAGNSAENSNGALANVPSDLSTVISVSATGTSRLVASGGGLNAAPGSDVLAFYSNIGAAKDLSAPGGDCGPTYPKECVAEYLILSTYIFESGPSAGQPGYSWMAGTSMASPHVAAVAAVVRALHPDWTPGAVRSWMKDTSDPIGDRQWFGQGLVNANSAAR
jgi:subtilisin family serine protease